MAPLTKDKMKQIWAGNQHMVLGSYGKNVRERLKVLEKTDFTTRIWRKDPTVWVPDRSLAEKTKELTDRLGWLDTPKEMIKVADDLMNFAKTIKDHGYINVILLGMGGSSLAPEVFMKSFGNKRGYPALHVMDSTHPDAISELEERIDLKTTLFIVSSKSGTTIETVSLYKYFFEKNLRLSENPGSNFIAITDPGSWLEKEAKEKGFRKIFSSPADVGGRFSALTYFGLVPAALIGLDIRRLLENAVKMSQASKDVYTLEENASVSLGAALAELYKEGRNKITFVASEPISSFLYWIEQLIAESSGKKGKGVLPVIDEGIFSPDSYGEDRVFFCIKLKEHEKDDVKSALDILITKGYPVFEIEIGDLYELGAEFFRWEMATAVLGSLLSINPFDQPNVELSKKKAKELMSEFEAKGSIQEDEPVYSDEDFNVYFDNKAGQNVSEIIKSFFDRAKGSDYIALMGYLPKNPNYINYLQKIRILLLKKYRTATTLGFGPRFLHSTGQLHKGDNNQGLFLQITAEPSKDFEVPRAGYSFKTLISVQARGDYKALKERERRVLRIHIKKDIQENLKKLAGKL